MRTGYSNQTLITGVVFKKNLGHYAVHVDGKVVDCAISSVLRRELVYPTADPNSLRPVVVDERKIQMVDPVAVGDAVRFIDAGLDTGMIVEVLPRRTHLSRRSSVSEARKHAFEQVIVANVDQVIPVLSAANPVPKWNLLDRYLVSAESLGLPALICITKHDLAEGDPELEAAVAEYRRVGYTLLLTSAQSGQGIADLRLALQGKLSVFIGKSGVGKTSLLNAIQPGLGLRVNQVNEKTGKGKHTTTHLEMFPLETGGSVVDTPGMREFGLWEVEDTDLALLFPEMRPFVGACRFGLDCSHEHEHGCAIRKAVQAGEISIRRYESFLRLMEN
jgi:ribosome biogenesis GTPase